MTIKANLRVGKPDTDPDAPSHTPGVREGNAMGSYASQVGLHDDGTVDARRSTGVNPGAKNPIDRRMPNLTPP